MGRIPLHVWVFAVGADPRCAADYNAAGCNVNSTGSEVAAIVIVAVIVGLAIFDLAWKLRLGTRGPVMRFTFAAGLAISRALSARRRTR